MAKCPFHRLEAVESWVFKVTPKMNVLHFQWGAQHIYYTYSRTGLRSDFQGPLQNLSTPVSKSRRLSRMFPFQVLRTWTPHSPHRTWTPRSVLLASQSGRAARGQEVAELQRKRAQLREELAQVEATGGWDGDMRGDMRQVLTPLVIRMKLPHWRVSTL